MTSPNTKCVMVLKCLWKISGTGDCVWDTHFSCCCFSYQATESLICSNTQFISLSIQLLSDMKTPENTLSLDCLQLTVKSFLEAHFSNALDLMFYCQHLIVKNSCLKILTEFTNILDILVILLLSVSNLRVKYWFIFFFFCSFRITFRITSRDSNIYEIPRSGPLVYYHSNLSSFLPRKWVFYIP